MSLTDHSKRDILDVSQDGDVRNNNRTAKTEESTTTTTGNGLTKLVEEAQANSIPNAEDQRSQPKEQVQPVKPQDKKVLQPQQQQQPKGNVRWDAIQLSAVQDNRINVIRSSAFGDHKQIPLQLLWKDQTVVITFLRRFGCQLCRFPARQLSALKPELDAHGIGLVAIGLEELGLEEFLNGNFFNGDLYLDNDKSCYKGLKLKRQSLFSGFGFFDRRVYKAISDSGETPGNFKGDGLQMGATFVIEKGGRVLLDHRQEYYGDSVPIEMLRQVLSLDSSSSTSLSSSSASAVSSSSASSSPSNKYQVEIEVCQDQSCNFDV